MYVLDTNAFYYAAGISECTYDVKKLRKLIKGNEVFLSTTSLFEFLIKYQGDIETVRLGGKYLWENHIRIRKCKHRNTKSKGGTHSASSI